MGIRQYIQSHVHTYILIYIFVFAFIGKQVNYLSHLFFFFFLKIFSAVESNTRDPYHILRDSVRVLQTKFIDIDKFSIETDNIIHEGSLKIYVMDG